MFRLLTSWRTFIAVFVGAALLLGVLAYNLSLREQGTALRRVVAEGELIETLLLTVRLSEGGGVLTEEAIDRIDAQVDVMVVQGNLIGLQLWTVGGELVYSNAALADSLTADERAALPGVAAGEPYVVLQGDGGRSARSATVLLRSEDTDGRPTGLVAEVMLPRHQMALELEAATTRLYAGAGLLFLLALVLALQGRRRLLRREHQALHDSLTGLGNRAQLAAAGAGLPGHGDHGSGNAALILIDLDGFKEVNDTLGHAIGDQLLVEVGSALRGAVRPGDVVVRLGGDEFAVLVWRLPDAARAVGAAQTIAAALHRPFTVDQVTLEVGASVGVALAPEHGTDLHLLLRRADVAMYQAKRDGGGVRLYDPGDDPYDESDLDLLSQLRGAIADGQLRLQYQPKVALREDRTVGFEALVRWEHPERGWLTPGVFLPLAERTALIRPLTDWVLTEAAGTAAGWRAAGWDVTVAVNIAPRVLLDPHLVARITDLLAQSGLPGSALELEITETAVMADPERAAATLRRLRAIGVAVSVDDFGAGYTSLSYLKRLPVQRLKIDRAFVTHLLHDERDEAVSRSVINLGHDLGLTVVAEGVETSEVLGRLRELGCDEVQGHLLARPLPPEGVFGWLEGETAGERRAASMAWLS